MDQPGRCCDCHRASPDHRSRQLDPPGTAANGCQVAPSGYLPAPVAQPGDHVNTSAEGGDVGAHNVDAGDLAVLDFGDPGLGYTEGIGQLCLGHPGRGAHLGQLATADVCFPALARRNLAGSLLFGRARVRFAALGLDVAPLGVAAAHRFFASSASKSARCWASRSSASGIASRYQPTQFPALSPATRKIASRLGSNANSSRISVLPDDGGLSSFMLWYRLP